MKDNYEILIDEDFKNSIQSILNRFSDQQDLILFKYDIMNIIKEKINSINENTHEFEKNIDNEIRFKHNETAIINANDIVKLIETSKLPVSCFFNFINEIKKEAEIKKSYIDNEVNEKPKLSI